MERTRAERDRDREDRAMAKAFDALGPDFDPNDPDTVKFVRKSRVFADANFGEAVADLKVAFRREFERSASRLRLWWQVATGR